MIFITHRALVSHGCDVHPLVRERQRDGRAVDSKHDAMS